MKYANGSASTRIPIKTHNIMMTFAAGKAVVSFGEMTRTRFNRAQNWKLENIGHQARTLTLHTVAATIPDMHASKVEQKRKNRTQQKQPLSAARCWRLTRETSPGAKLLDHDGTSVIFAYTTPPRAIGHLTPDRASRQYSSWTRSISEEADWVSRNRTRNVLTIKCRVQKGVP